MNPKMRILKREYEFLSMKMIEKTKRFEYNIR